jgi:hypothetical protein
MLSKIFLKFSLVHMIKRAKIHITMVYNIPIVNDCDVNEYLFIYIYI